MQVTVAPPEAGATASGGSLVRSEPLLSRLARPKPTAATPAAPKSIICRNLRLLDSIWHRSDSPSILGSGTILTLENAGALRWPLVPPPLGNG